MKKSTLLKLLCVVMVLTMVFTACGPAQEEEEKTQLTVAVTADFDSIDPHIMLASDTDRILFNVYEGLTSVDASGNIVPALAEGWEWAADNMSITFKIRKGVKFHDGQELNADDVVYSYQRMAGQLADQSAVKATFVNGLEKIEKIDDYTVKMTLKKQDASWLGYMHVGIIKKDAGATIIDTPNGTGPYKLASYEPSVGCTLERHEDHWEGNATIDVINVKMYADATASLLAMQNGEIQMLGVSQQNLSLVPENYETLNLSTNTPICVQINCKEGVFSDVRVRQALNYATDKKALVDALSPGSEIVHGPITGAAVYWQNPNIDLYPYNVEKAKELLKEAGQENLEFEFMWFSNLSSYYADVVVVLQDQWKKAGINAKLVDTDWSTFLSTVYKNPERKFDAALFGYTGKLDPVSYVDRWESTYKNNVMQFTSAEMDETIKALKSTADQQERQKLMYKAQEILAENAVGVWLHDAYSYLALDDRYAGYTPYVITFWDFSTIYLK